MFALHWTYGLSGLLMPMFAPVAGLMVVLYALARSESRRIARAALALCVAPVVVNSYNVAVLADEANRILTFVVVVVPWSALVLTVWGLGRNSYAADRRVELEKQEQTAAAVRAERLNMARELHDIVSHSVSAMILQAAGAQTYVAREDHQVRAALEAIENTGVQAMGELHRLLELLRTASPEQDREEYAPPPSLRDLDALVSSVRATGVDVEVVVEGHPTELDRGVGLVAYRIVQEALTNTIKHGGRGASARVHLRWELDALGLTVRNRAGLGTRGAGTLSSGHGLTGLAERVSLVGGTLETGPVADGFLVRAHLPVHPSIPQQESTLSSSKDTS
ncbi:sensor histidine kinase [Kocuria sp. M1R5S2]|uniref:sensor histidine kinase n=1 Tax=Kocuria rhizosphaerae TaxID=3376285 RepID=UPI0037A9A752